MTEQWRRRHYLVAIPEGEIAGRGIALQKEFSRRYGVYREPYPPLHLTVGIISFPPGGLKPLADRLAETTGPHLPLKLQTLGESCFPEPYKSINLAVKPTPPLKALSERVIDAARAAGFTAEPFDRWDYHISLVNSNYAAREWTEAEYREACRRLAGENLIMTGHARRLELWEPGFPPLKVLAQFV